MKVDLGIGEPFTSAELSAHVDRGRRSVHWHLTEPGQYARNAYEMAWIDADETEPWTGEVRWVSAYRQVPTGPHGRESFTDKGRQAVQAQLVPKINRYGFDRLWTALRTQCYDVRSVDSSRRAAAEYKAIGAWWDEQVILTETVATGDVTYVPVRPGRRGIGPDLWPTVRVPGSTAGYRHHALTSTEVSAEIRLGGEHVGWMTRDGSLVPLDDALVALR